MKLAAARIVNPPSWMTAPQTRAVMAALNDKGTIQTLFVGGCVRNELMQRPVKDVDLATIHAPDDVIKRLQNAGIRHIPTGIDHGTVTALTDGHTFEITTLRRDVSTDGRRATIAYTDDWIEDARRRDFTMNTLLADDSGHVFDPLGAGIDAIDQGQVVFVGDPDQRIAEDYLRILRFFRFHALYGHGDPDADAVRACAAAGGQIKTLSRERITQELSNILNVPDPSETLALMFSHRILADLFDHDFDVQRFSRFCQLQLQENAIHVMARLTLMTGFNVAILHDALSLSSAQKAMIAAIARTYERLNDLSALAIRQAVYDHGNDVVTQVLFLKSSAGVSVDADSFRVAHMWNPPKFPLAGQDVMDLGVKPGPLVGRYLKDTETWWRQADFAPDRAACLARLMSALP